MSTLSSPEQRALAWRIHKKGLPPVTMRKEEIPIPEPQQGEVLVKVHCAALNPVDWKVAGHAPGFFQKFPRCIGIDLSGIVLRTGSGLTEEQRKLFLANTRVMGLVPIESSLKTGRGSLTTHVCVRVEHLTPIPTNLEPKLTFEEAAGFPLVATTALAIGRRARAGDKVLVLGGSTSVGLVLIQMLKAEGVEYIVATASGEKKDKVKSLGADEVIDYREADVIQALTKNHSENPFDLILDTVGDFSVYRASPAYLKESGEYANVGASDLQPEQSFWSILSFIGNAASIFLPWWLGGVPRKASVGGNIRDGLPEFVHKYVATRKATCPIDSTFSFDDAPKAYERLMTGRALGKVVVKVIE